MTEPTTPPLDASQVSHYRLNVEFDVTGATWGDARAFLDRTLSDGLDPDRADPAGRAIHSWTDGAPPGQPVAAPLPGWEALQDSGIPEMVAEMFPPEPSPAAYIRDDGSLDADGLADAQEQWREKCLTLGLRASRLPELLDRLERTENLRDDVVDVLERFPLPVRPNRQDYQVTAAPRYPAEIDEVRYGADLRAWRTQFDQVVEDREQALRTVLAGAGGRSPYLPARFAREWVPADLLAVQVLRAVAQPGRTVSAAGLLSSQQSYELAAVLAGRDPVVSVPDPDDPTGVPIYEGWASVAHELLAPGLYSATGRDGTGQYRLVVAHAPVADTVMASAAFRVDEHEAASLDKIANLLHQLDAGSHPDRVFVAINAVVADTGREGADLDTLGAPALQPGAAMRTLLAHREQDLTPGEPTPGQGGRGEPGRRL